MKTEDKNPNEEHLSTDQAESSPDTKTIQATKKRNKLLLIFGVVALVLAVGYAIIYFIFLAHYETTDNAYVQSDIIQITPRVTGTVLSIDVKDTDFVKEGQTLLTLDKTDALMALEQAEANLAQAVRDARTLYINNETLNAQIKLSQANLAQANVAVQTAQGDLLRRTGIGDAISKEDLAHAKEQLATAKSAQKSAEAAVSVAQEQLKSNQSKTNDIDLLVQPSVLEAKAKVKEAYIALSRMTIPAPADGYVAKRSVQVGQKVGAGSPLMSVIPLQQVWVDANLKEIQLQNIRIGQKVALTADIYGTKVKYNGVVEGMSAGTGSAFSLLPAQNATGNWIKVVQRLPVRISMDPKELQEHPLQVGLSMEVSINTKDKSGRMLSDSVSKSSAMVTTAFKVDALDTLATEYADKIINQQLGKDASKESAPKEIGTTAKKAS